MAVGQGYDSYVSFIKEDDSGVDPGTARDFYLRLISESMQTTFSPQPFPGMAGPGTRKYFLGNLVVNGDVAIEFHYAQCPELIMYALGVGGYTFSASTPEPGAETHIMTDSADQQLESFSMEISRGDTPTGKVFLFTGCVIDQLTLEWSNEALIGLSISVIAQAEAVDVAAELPVVYPDPDVPVLWHDAAAFTVLGSVATQVKDGSLTINNNMTADRFNMTNQLQNPLRAGNRSIEGALTMEFEDFTHYTKAIDGTRGTFDVTFTSDTDIGATSTPYSLRLQASATLSSGMSMSVSDPGPIDLPVTFFVEGTDTVTTITAVNEDTDYT